MRKLISYLLLTACTLGLPLFGSETNYSEVKEKISDYIEQGMKKNGIAGLSIALVDEEKVVWEQGFGYADVKRKTPAAPKTIYKMASISKLFTGIAIMQLVEEGKIALDSPLTDYIPEFSIKSRFPGVAPFTIRNMLTHHSGLPVDLSFPGVEPFSAGAVKRNEEYEENLINYLKTVHLAYRPEYVHSYSNIAYDLLAVVVERVTGMDFDDYMKSRILLPLGMESGSFEEFFLRDRPGMSKALPHKKNAPGEKRTFPGKGAAGLSASVSDMSAFIKMLLAKGNGPGGPILKEETLEQMWTIENKNTPLDGEIKIGLSFFLGEKDLNYAGNFCGHSGNFKYYHNALKVLPDHGLGVIVSVNSSGGFYFVHQVAVKALQEALKEKKGIEPPREELYPVKTAPETPDKYTGLFGTVLIGPVGIESKREKLFLTIMGLRLRLELLNDGRLKPRSSINYFKDIYFQVKTVNGRKRLYARKGSYYFILGEDYKKPDLTGNWLDRTGTYEIVTTKEGPQRVSDIGDGRWKGSKKSFTVSYKKGLFRFNTPEWGTLLLTPLDDNRCLITGLGRGANETVYFDRENGEVTIKWAGYKLRKVAP